MVNQKTIKELINEVRQELHRNCYSKSTIAAFETRWRIFESYALKKNVSIFTTEFGLSFLEEKCNYLSTHPLKKTQYEYVRTINMIDEYSKYGSISTKRLARKEYIFPDCFSRHVQMYISRRKAEGLSDSRIKSYKIYLERFTEYLYNEGLRQFSELQHNQIDNFIISLSKYTASTVANTFGCLRGFLSYMHEQGILGENLSLLIPAIRYSNENTIPSAYTKDEVEKLLGCVDRGNTKGKRDYAMMVLAVRLGLRSSDICGLTLGSLKWEQNLIEIVQAKTEKVLQLPLLNEVGDAIIEYLHHRPKADSKFVFIRLVPPFERLENHSLYTIVCKYMKRAKIKIPKGKRHGPHALRHSLSSIMLESRVPLPIISDILSHSSSDTTKIYLKIDLRQLRECALSVPQIDKSGMED